MLAGCGWRLVLDASRASPTPELPDWLRVESVGEGGLVESEGVLRDWFARHGVSAAIVRPDHYVYGTAADGETLTRELKGLAERLIS
jgi:3-(3-hydroxy-phenyl)propionate hydroxylase